MGTSWCLTRTKTGVVWSNWGRKIMEMGQVHTGLGNTVVLTLLIFSTECPGPVAMFKPKKEERKKKGRGLGGPERENQSTVITAHTSHSFLRHSHSPQPRSQALPSAPWCCLRRTVDCPAVISVNTLEAKSLRIPLIPKYFGAGMIGCEAS